MKLKSTRSLKARALQWLAQREQSRVELRRKLLPLARAEDAAGEAAGLLLNESTPTERVEAVLEWLESHQYLSQTRFAESRVHARSARFGNLRIQQELKQHEVGLTPEALSALRDSELERARAVRDRKFSQWPAGLAERARQSRFLAGRGFSPEVINRVFRGPEA